MAGRLSAVTLFEAAGIRMLSLASFEATGDAAAIKFLILTGCEPTPLALYKPLIAFKGVKHI